MEHLFYPFLLCWCLGYGDPFPVLCCCSPGEGSLPCFWPSLLQEGFTGQETAHHVRRTLWRAAHHDSHPRGDTLVMYYGPVWCVLCVWCSAEPSEGGICFRVIHSWQGLHCDAAGLFQFYVSMKIQPSYTAAKKMWGSHGMNSSCFHSGGTFVQLFPMPDTYFCWKC